MKHEPIPNPRRIGKHISEILDFLHAEGAGEIVVVKNKHLRLSYTFAGHRLTQTVACTPRDDGDCVNNFRQAFIRTVKAEFRR